MSAKIEAKPWVIVGQGRGFDGLRYFTVECGQCGLNWEQEEIEKSGKCDCGNKYQGGHQ